MRPVDITLEGFMAYRSRTVVDFEGADFFSLSGPTGAGKSSLVDAMVFALYGRIPRLGGRAVAPVITAGAQRARVAFTFEAEGDRYVVSRVAERTKGGASVREARLETEEGTPVAAGADEVTSKVEELLRLRFDDFTKTVVLPQGEFARFLRAGSKERRELMRELLGLDVYGRVRELATIRRSVAGETAAAAESRLAGLTVPSDEEMVVARERLGSLTALAESLPERLTRLVTARRALEESEGTARKLDEANSRLSSVEAPEHLEELEERYQVARDTAELVEAEADSLRSEITSMEETVAAMPSGEAIAGWRQTGSKLNAVRDRLADSDLQELEQIVEATGRDLRAAEARHGELSALLTEAHARHAATALVADLRVGEPCPVCSQRVSTIPETVEGADDGEIQKGLEAASQRLVTAREAHQSARLDHTGAEATRAELSAQAKDLEATLVDAPPVSRWDDLEESLRTAIDHLSSAKKRLVDMDLALRQARRDHESASEAVRSVGKLLVLAHRQVADLGPPLGESDDPVVQWKELVVWREVKLAELAEEASSMVGLIQERAEAVSIIQDEIEHLLETAGVQAKEPYQAEVAAQMERARHQLESFEATLVEAAELAEQTRQTRRDEAVAAALVGHLRADGFERWLMAGAISGLVSQANHLLDQLSGGGYSLSADEDGAFGIVDHTNADEPREVATLSGGETFLVSLALALSLAETLSAGGGAGLDAIILDEGFGTLDEESLDLVASVLEDLVGRGLMVGVITHVKELAARAPVRFQVERGRGGARVEATST